MSENSQALEVARSVAHHIAATALWHEDRCNWLGAMPEEGPGGAPVQTVQSLGSDLYGGTAGVGLVLAEVAEVLGDARLRRTALGALNHAQAHFARHAQRQGHGLYSGSVGIACALARSAIILREPRLGDAARDLARKVQVTHETSPVECDLMSGLAGTAIGMLRLSRLLDDPQCARLAMNIAEELLQHAEAHDQTLCWRSSGIAHAPALLGFSHGASGIAWALLEVARACGDSRFAAAADQAFAYERSHYDAGARNWPDLRGATHSHGPRSFATFWCHGAPGIALARLRAHELRPSESTRLEAEQALATTAASIRASLDSPHTNYSLCHGLCGNAEVLGEGETLDGRHGSWIRAVADRGAEKYSAQPGSWPCGTQGGETAGLFLGLSGISYFYLRLARPELPSVVMLRP